MKQFGILSIVAIICIGMAACVGGNKTGKGSSDNDSIDSTAIKSDSVNEVKGVVGEGTSMHSLELITENGDSLYFEYDNNIVGGVVCGDFVDVSYNYKNGEFIAASIVNMTSIAHVWTIDGSNSKQHLEIDTKGTATTYGMGVDYTKWSLYNGRLILEGAGKADTFDISLLTDDSLIIENTIQKIKMKKMN